MTAKPNQGQWALQLSGGGGRAAYQIGVLKAIANFYPRNHGLPFPILCGTSAGAINATTLACYAGAFHKGVRKLEWIWRNFTSSKVYHAQTWPLGRHLLHQVLHRKDPQQPPSLLNNAPLQTLLQQVLPLEKIDRHIDAGHLKALTVAASSYRHPCCVNFFQGQPNLSPWQRFRRRGVPASIDIHHLMASAAIPLVFPSVAIDGEHYGDGAVHQLSPLSAPIHLGADRIFIINLESPGNPAPQHNPPNSGLITGHLLDAVFSDALNSDLERIARINASLALIPPERRVMQPLKTVETMTIKPSQNLDAIALRHYGSLPRGVRSLLKVIGVDDQSESSLLSYLMFEAAYCQELIELGFNDANDKQRQLKLFFDLDDHGPSSSARSASST
ncbi:patatin-like phospholipase family protein [Ferrimonas sp. SCSIO 43195]|uniref:patatin-like phospholipase family protein n=1 Tax=Ferrimonas sp. SCSIO 43195 TaxID=2822844 RepID=UPI0020754DA6|nr:patatin-like phospholipase family protein [Ferrimonas sp. SCSIO 43195]USD36756.1 patatin-like phospholipase family protein [Ferrimonas sp. SCSIO 43195]